MPGKVGLRGGLPLTGPCGRRDAGGVSGLAFDLYPDLVVSADEVSLKPIPWSDVASYGAMVQAGLFAPGEPQTLGPWYRPDNLTASARAAMAFQLITWADLGLDPGAWTLEFGVYLDPALVGTLMCRAQRFSERREVETGSLLAPRWRGRGIGTKARAAALHLIFDLLQAEAATSTIVASNAASRAVSRHLGYQSIGTGTNMVNGEPVLTEQLRMTRDTWAASHKPWQLTARGTDQLVDLLTATGAP